LKRMIILAALVALLGVAAVASATTSGHKAATLPVLQISETGGKMQVTGSPQSGATELTFTTDLKPAKGDDTGAVFGVIRLNSGVTPEQFVAGIKPDGSNLEKFGSLETAEGASKGQTIKVQTVLKPAQYVIADLNAKPSDANRHTVIQVAQNPAPAALPAADATFRMKDYRFTGPKTIKRGGLVRTVNSGKEQHMAVALRVKNAKQAKTFEKLLRKGKDGKVEKKIRGIGFLSDDVSPGAVNQGVVTMPRGTYVLACFMTNKKGVEHTRLGMERTLIVK
jgi:hypothetical protein